jgi:alpha-beta hydrolase superfamily lysophospholipase
MMASISLPPLLRLSRLACPALRVLAMALVLGLGACAADYAPEGAATTRAVQTSDGFVMRDGTVLPYRSWMPPPGVALTAVVLALHGMNDSRDAWEYPAPALAAAGIAVFAPDQRGFGATAARGYWPGAAALQDDARTMARLLRARYPDHPLYLMGESMGAAVLLALAASPDPPAADGWIFSAPPCGAAPSRPWWSAPGCGSRSILPRACASPGCPACGSPRATTMPPWSACRAIR